MNDFKNNPGGEIPDEMDEEFSRLVREDYVSFLKEIDESPDSGGEAKVGEGSFQNQFEGFENRLPAPDYRLISDAIPDEDYIFLCEEILDHEDLALPAQRQNFMDLASALKIVDEDRFNKYTQDEIVNAQKFYYLLDSLEHSTGPENYQQLIREARKIKVLYPGDSRRILLAIGDKRWGKILETLKKLRVNEAWLYFVELYSLAFELNPNKLASEMPVDSSLLTFLKRFFTSSGNHLTYTQRINFSSDMDALTFGEESRFDFFILENAWAEHIKHLIGCIKNQTLDQIVKLKNENRKGRALFSYEINNLVSPLYEASRCKYTLVKLPKKSGKR